MKRLLRNITASNEIPSNSNILFTPDDVRQLLLQIDELKNCNITLTQSEDGSVEFIIGNSAYYVFQGNEGGTVM